MYKMKYLIFDAGPIISLTMNGIHENLKFSGWQVASLIGGRSLRLQEGLCPTWQLKGGLEG